MLSLHGDHTLVAAKKKPDAVYLLNDNCKYTHTEEKKKPGFFF